MPSSVNSPAIRLHNSAHQVAPIGHYSHVAVHGGLAYVSGQLPVDPAGRQLAVQPFEDQALQVLANIDGCLAVAGTTRGRLIQVTVYVTDINQWPTFDGIYQQWIGDHRPARAVAGVNELHYGSAIEVHAIAAVG